MSILAIVSTAMAPLDRELPYRATGRRDAERDRTLLARRLSGDGTEARPNPGRLHANPTDHFAARQNEAPGRERGHEHAGDVKQTAGGDGMRRAKAVSNVAEKRRERAHQQHRQRVG